MLKRGPKPKGKVVIKWSHDFAYAIGLMVADGNLSKNGRHITFTSKDIEQVKIFMKCLGITAKIGRTLSGYNKNVTNRVQFSDTLFHEWLRGIGIMPNKSKIISEVNIPKTYFLDFFRGCFDGDGSVYAYWDKRWRSSYMFYLSLTSGSRPFLDWISQVIQSDFGIEGHITKAKQNTSAVYQLKYSKRQAIKLIGHMYSRSDAVCLQRKRLKIKKILAIVDTR